ncbi:S-adenosyl-L-methionine-dependent methyltransferase [Glarea lozoyensis ATCC 20868]|uniref:S-adenosyl-L-methionine-dependent methyltransferase n=1 Tax=Glarea lozoyensis (strain ATCC 20868 / MF5171) TaxID=1116229 RepID=S3DBG7_GLAL2|nr:S-adenosyl-L-methionine-dependent methyltransferase [Glarea lozoyensis ATCC 20868]EPE29286.1 S-adenosyl-L-methionine-dependent methyltransferase [Glarea lozoyensis ATCC 20868]
MTSKFQLDERANIGFGDASSYDKFRPSYPPEAVEKLLAHLGLSGVDGARVVDLASGTGKFTELLAGRPEKFEIVAVEPHQGMRLELEKKELKGVKSVDGDACNIPLEDGWGDALIAAQAFHWFATRDALNEIHRVLRPGATFGMIWNIEDYNSPLEWNASSKWEQKLKDIIWSLDDGQHRFRHFEWKKVFEAQTETTPLQTLVDTFTHNFPDFSLPLGIEEVPWTVYLTDEAIWSRYYTLSQIAMLKGQKLEDVKKQVFAALKGEDVERNAAGEVALHARTYFCFTSRV